MNQEKQAFKKALEGLDCGRAVTLGSYVGLLEERVEELEEELERQKHYKDMAKVDWYDERDKARKEIERLKSALNGSAVIVNHSQARVKELTEQNKRYRDVLEFYARVGLLP